MEGSCGMKAPDANRLVVQLFRSYYKRLREDDIYVNDLQKREFAFTYFTEGGMRRHIAFGSTSELVRYLAEAVPRHAYHSAAYYRDPAARTMDDKGWEGADLIFDIDVDHIDTPCKEQHDKWFCRACGSTGWGAPSRCPSCGSENLEKHTWVCNVCISVARDEILKLVDFLERDFGFTSHDLFITFSGHRGFHVRVENEEVRMVSQDGRREIVDHIKGLGLDIRQMVVKTAGGYRLRYGTPVSGWYGRIARWSILTTEEEKPVLSLEEWEKLLSECVAKEAVAIDERVTVDTKRLIRLPNSLHGKTGLRVAPLTVQDLENEDLLGKAKVFRDGEVAVEFENEPPKTVLDISSTASSRTLPLYAAVYMLLNGVSFSKFVLL
ncbi:MAG: DNA primase small subunit PriS [Thermofilaceae archaeon]